MKKVIDKIKNMSKKSKIIISISLVIIIVGVVLLVLFLNKKDNTVIDNNENNNTVIDDNENNNEENNDDGFIYDSNLPKPEITTGQRGELGIDKNINEKTIDNYLNRKDSVYRDMRMLEDPANYENIDGNRFLDGYIEGFEVVPLPYILPVKDLPKEVGNTYTGTTLFHVEDDVYVPNYEESMSIIEKLFPKDKYIFLMCGGGGYAGMMKKFLVSMGWKEDRIYNVGGFWYYNGENSVYTEEGGSDIYYDFENVPYHNIEFSKLTKTTNYVAPDYGVESVEAITKYVKVEKDMSFKLSVVVLPNEVKNKKLKWSSEDPDIATVDANGLVRGVKPGNTYINVESVEDPNKKTYIDVLVTLSEEQGKVTLSDVNEEIKIFKNNDPEALNTEFYEIIDKNEDIYYNDGRATAAWRDLYDEYQSKRSTARDKRTDTFNNMIDAKKTFIVLINSKDCGDEFRVVDSAEEILKKNNIPYFYTYEEDSGIDTAFFDSTIDTTNLDYGVVAIVVEGKIRNVLRRDYDSIKSDKETETWLKRYIDFN